MANEQIDQIRAFEKWVEAVLSVAQAEGMPDETVIPTWPDGMPEGLDMPPLTVGAVAAAHARYAGGGSEVEPFGYLIYDHNENTEDFTRIKPESINREHEEIAAVYLRPPAPAVLALGESVSGMGSVSESCSR